MLETKPQPLRQLWEKELQVLKENRRSCVIAETNIKTELRNINGEIKREKTRFREKLRKMEEDRKSTQTYLNRVTKNRRMLDRRIAGFWKKKSNWKYNRRMYSANHPGEVYNRVISAS